MADLSVKTLRKDIEDILKDADLATLSGKKVRKQLEEKYDVDLSSRKKEVDEILMETLDEIQNKKADSEDEAVKESSESEEIEDDQSPPPKKKKKSVASKEDESDKDSGEEEVNDEELAMQLHKKINSESRRTRGGRVPQLKAVPKKKSEAGAKKPPKDCYLSPKLAAIVGAEKMPRSQVVKRMWEIIKERNLQDPKQKNFMICDDELYTVFGRKRVKTFGMMKYLSDHIFRNEKEYEKSTC